MRTTIARLIAVCGLLLGALAFGTAASADNTNPNGAQHIDTYNCLVRGTHTTCVTLDVLLNSVRATTPTAALARRALRLLSRTAIAVCCAISDLRPDSTTPLGTHCPPSHATSGSTLVAGQCRIALRGGVGMPGNPTSADGSRRLRPTNPPVRSTVLQARGW